jgi:hypothetical protein
MLKRSGKQDSGEGSPLTFPKKTGAVCVECTIACAGAIDIGMDAQASNTGPIV